MSACTDGKKALVHKLVKKFWGLFTSTYLALHSTNVSMLQYVLALYHVIPGRSFTYQRHLQTYKNWTFWTGIPLTAALVPVFLEH